MNRQSEDLLPSLDSNSFPSEDLSTDVFVCEHTVSRDYEDRIQAEGEIETEQRPTKKMFLYLAPEGSMQDPKRPY